MGAVGNNSVDLYKSQQVLNQTSDTVVKKMSELAQKMATPQSAAQLQKLQLDIAEQQRCLDALKAAEEKLEKAAENMSKFIQAQ